MKEDIVEEVLEEGEEEQKDAVEVVTEEDEANQELGKSFHVFKGRAPSIDNFPCKDKHNSSFIEGNETMIDDGSVQEVESIAPSSPRSDVEKTQAMMKTPPIAVKKEERVRKVRSRDVRSRSRSTRKTRSRPRS